MPPTFTWWKGAELYDRFGNLKGATFTQDDKKSGMVGRDVTVNWVAASGEG